MRNNNGKVSTAQRRQIRDLVKEMLERLGIDVESHGIARTPERVEKAMQYMLSGYGIKVESVINGAIFDSSCDEMVIVKDIEFYSLCEHHLLPFFGRCHIAYLPQGRIIGLSKIPRIVDMFSRRLQVQERLTQQIATILNEKLSPKGVGVIMEGYHLCMMMRGVQKQTSLCTTSAMIGRFKTDIRTRQEFMKLVSMSRPF